MSSATSSSSKKNPSPATATSLSSIDWKSPEFRRQLLLQLKDTFKQLTPLAHKQTSSPATSAKEGNASSISDFLTESNPLLQTLCMQLEFIFLHGMKFKEFQNTIPFWGLLERLEVLTPPSIPLRNAVGAVACISQLRTPLAKARGWIRQCLNSHTLDDNVTFMCSQQTWIGKFYYPEAIVAVKEDFDILVSVDSLSLSLSLSLLLSHIDLSLSLFL
jgi:hypothetical protein